MSREEASGAHKVNQTNRRTDHKMLSVIVLSFRVKPVTPTAREGGTLATANLVRAVAFKSSDVEICIRMQQTGVVHIPLYGK